MNRLVKPPIWVFQLRYAPLSFMIPPFFLNGKLSKNIKPQLPCTLESDDVSN